MSRNNRKIKLSVLTSLIKLGWKFIAPAQVRTKRNQRQPVLGKILHKYLANFRFNFAGKEYPLSDKTINNLLVDIANPSMNQGLLAANEKIYNYLVSGISVTEIIEGKKLTPSIPLIDWQNRGNNSFLFTTNFSVECANAVEMQELDCVCFINGIPLAFIIVADPTKTRLDTIISQLIYSQGQDRLAHVFAYSQLLIATDGTSCRYATCGSAHEIWKSWNNEDLFDANLQKIKNKKLPVAQRNRLVSALGLSALDMDEKQDAEITNQERFFAALLSPDNFLDIIHYFTSFDKKSGRFIAWFHQIAAINQIIKYLSPRNGRKKLVGDKFICHMSGSGKSVSLLFLIKAFLLNPALKDYRVILVADRDKLENHFKTIFTSGNELLDKLLDKKEGESLMPTSGRRLAEQIVRSTQRIMYAIPEKFNTAIHLPECSNNHSNIVILISDEVDISGDIRRALPNAVSIKFTSHLPSQELDTDSLIHVYYPHDNINHELEPMQDMGIIQYATAAEIFGNPAAIREDSGNYQVDLQTLHSDEISLEFQKKLKNKLKNNKVGAIFFNLLKTALIDASGEIKNSWIDLANEVDKTIADAIENNSINFTSAEREIRKKLLPLVFTECKTVGAGTEEANKIINSTIEVVYTQFSSNF